jgi:hypothetical protein
MASPFAKRLEKLEQLLASKINRPLAFLWQHAGESQEDACIRCGYDPSQADRIRFYRWMTLTRLRSLRHHPGNNPKPGLRMSRVIRRMTLRRGICCRNRIRSRSTSKS